ncbi:MAG: hypothetical protein JSW55_04205 [Chloroflexota bacterium]|nr:MAG: hypothetical protein JSW55_04205 [Chloroflexota bacterium]
MHRVLRFRTLSLVLGLFSLLLLSPTVAAHTEGTMQLAAEPAGPYMLTVWTSPDPAEAGELHVAMAVVLAEDASPVLEADVLVRLTPEDGGPVVSGPATTEDSENKFLHEAILEVPYGGEYLVEIFVEGADGGVGEASFPLMVEGRPALNLPMIVLTAGAVAIAVFLVRRYLRRR